jgi:tetratricopeptide (TPR) repeat protein
MSAAAETPIPAATTRPPAGVPAAATAPSPGPDRQLHAQDSDRVYQAAGNQYIVDRMLPAPAAAANTLPRDTAAFTGRREELDGVITTATSRAAAGETIPVFTVAGMPGVGKTTFAVHAAHQLSSVFPDGQMFVDMHAHTAGQGPVEPAEALFSLLSLVGARPGDIPDDVDGRSALWRARVAGRRSILIIDNVTGHRQVEPLLPGAAGCLVLVTSRRRLTGLGARHAAATVPLEPLAPGPAADLFSRLTGRNPADGPEQPVAELVRLCGFLPLAISLLAARLRPEPQWRVQALVDDLAAARDRLAHMRAEDLHVAAAFDLSYRCLPASRRRFFRCLGLFPGTDIDAFAAAALAGVGLATARRHLDALYEDHLVEQPMQGRYRLYDLLGAYARALVDRDPARHRELAAGRLLDYYLYAAGTADQQIAARPRPTADLSPRPAAVPELVGAERAARWMAAELPNLLACATHAMSQGDDARLTGFSAALATFLRRTGPYRPAVALHRAAADAAGRRGDRTARAAALFHVGVLLRRAGDYPAAGTVLTEARSLYRELGDLVGEADVLTVAGIVRRLAGDYPIASEVLAEALARYQELADPAGQAEVLAELTVIRWLTDEYTAAVRLLDQALALYRRAGNRLGQAGALLHLGMVRRLMHDYPAATRAVHQARTLYRDLGSQLGLAHAQFSLGVLHRLTGDHRAAAALLEESQRVYRQLGDRLGHANSLRELGVLRRLTGDHARATPTLLEALSLYQDLGNRRGQAEALQELGEARRQAGDPARATQDLTRAHAILVQLGSRGGQAEVLNYLGALLLDTADPLARDRFRAALRLAREVGNPLEEARALDGMAGCSLHRSDPGDAARQLRAALAIYRRLGAPEAAAAEAALASLSPSPPGSRDRRP